MSDLLHQRFRILIDFKSKFDTPEIKKESEDELNKILSQETFTIECVNMMVESISQYCAQEEKLINAEHKKVINNDLKVINDFQVDYQTLKGEAKSSFRFSKTSFLEKGVSLCTILTGFQRSWINNLSNHISEKVKNYRKTKDYERYKLIPGQHLFYYGAFSGTFTGKYSPSTHHFIYVGKGLILEVGTDLVKGCLDIHTNPEPKTVFEILKNPKSYFYKSTMSYFGLSTITNAVKWAEMYSQTNFYIYDFPNDLNTDVIVKRLQRGKQLVGKWMYSLFLLSNNCENAATYISIGHSISTQSCLSDTLINSLYTVISNVPFMSTKQKHVVESGFLSNHSFEYTLKFNSDIPTCDKMDSYADRFVSSKLHICDGSPIFQYDPNGHAESATCKIDKETCETCTEEFDDIDIDATSSRVCKEKSGKKHKLYKYW